MIKKPTVSIVIPTHNYAHFLDSCLKSVFSQTFKNFEVILVDDASTDNTLQVIRKYQHKINYFKNKSKQGFSKSLTIGAKKAQGKYITFLSADDLLLPNFLYEQVQILDDNPDAGLVHSAVNFINSEGKIIGRSKIYKNRKPRNIYNQLVIGNYIMLLTVLTYTHLVKETGYFNNNLKQMPDFDMWIKISYLKMAAYNPKILANYRKHDLSLTSDIKKDFKNIGLERNVILKETIQKRNLPFILKLLVPFLFADAILVSKFKNSPLVKPIAVISLSISILTTKVLRFLTGIFFHY